MSTTYAQQQSTFAQQSPVTQEAQRFADMINQRLDTALRQIMQESGGGARGFGQTSLGYGQQAGAWGQGAPRHAQEGGFGGGTGWAGTRDMGPDLQAQQQPGMQQGWQQQPGMEMGATEVRERFLPLLGTLLPAVVSAVPAIIEKIQQNNRDIIPPSRDPQQIERDFLSILGALTPAVVQAIPQLIGAFAGNRDMPQNDQEMSTRWFAPLAAAIVPHLVSAVPQIVQAFAGGRRDISTRAYDPEVTQRFLGPILGSVLSTLPQHLPQLISAFTGRRFMPQFA